MKEILKHYSPKCEQEKEALKRIDLLENNFNNLLYRENDYAHYTSSAFIINKDRTKVLFINHKLYDAWGWVGGHMDGEDDFRAIALKEVQEETGLKNLEFLSEEVASVDILPVVGHLKNNKWVSPHIHLSVSFVLIADENEKLVENEDETKGIQWFEISELDKVVKEEHMLPIYNKLKEFSEDQK